MDSSLSSPQNTSASAFLQSPPAAQPLFGSTQTASSKPGDPSLDVDTSFYSGIPASSNSQTLYIHVPRPDHAANGSGAGGSEFWVTVPWSKIVSKLLEQPNLTLSMIDTLKSSPIMKTRALRILSSGLGENGNSSQRDFSLFSPSSPMIANPNVSLFTPAHKEAWHSPSEYGHPSHFHGGIPVSLGSIVHDTAFHLTKAPLTMCCREHP